MSGEIPAVTPSHVHSLPWKSTGFGSTGYPDGHLIQCRAGCGRWFFSGPCYESYGPTEVWRPVRWWHRRLRRRIAEFSSGVREDQS